jgi:hypothetical protein
MRARQAYWKSSASVLVAAETLALFGAYWAFGLGDQIRGSVQSPWMQALGAQILVVIQGVLPSWLQSSVMQFAATAGLGSIASFARGATSSLLPKLGLSSAGGAVVAPAYFAARRILRTPLSRPGSEAVRGVHWKIRPPKTDRVQAPAPALSAGAMSTPG